MSALLLGGALAATALGLYLYSRRRRGASPPARIAIDCGGVISVSDTDGRGDDMRKRLMAMVPSEACVRTVRAIVEVYGAEHVYVLSKCGHLTQCATVIMMHGSGFFQATGLRPRNVLFCTERQGGTPITEAQMELLRPPEPTGPFADRQWPQLPAHESPRVAPGRVGKGVVAAAFGLTTLIDDRAECLGSFYAEGPLHAAPSGSGLLLHFGADSVSQTSQVVKAELKEFHEEWERGFSELYRPVRDWEAVSRTLGLS